VTLIVSNIFPFAWDANFASAFNAEVPGIVNERKEAGKSIYFVDGNKEVGFVQGDWSSDNLHPSAEGYKKIASVWYSHLAPVLTSGFGQTRIIKRDPHKWPFAQNAIWNTPIGSDAVYVPANIQPAMAAGITIDEDYIVMRPEAMPIEIMESDAGWDSDKSRCENNGVFHMRANVPRDFIVSPETWDGLTPNAGLAFLSPDGQTIKQTQPFANCMNGNKATSKYMFPDESIFGEGIGGAHGGSGMSAIGGTIRAGELVPGGEIRHAMKINVFGKKNLYYDDVTKGYRWPALRADSYAKGNYGTEGDPPLACRMGSLLALPADLDLTTLGLETEPARILARAFQNYGAYIVDDTFWDVYALITEWGPDGRVADEFKSVWGFDIRGDDNPAWESDISKIFSQLNVIDNNTANTIGGGGTSIAGEPPDFGRAGNQSPFAEITTPHDYEMVGGKTVDINAKAYDEDGSVEEVEFYVDETLIGESYTRPYKISYAFEAGKKYRITVKAVDNEGATGVSMATFISDDPGEVPNNIAYEQDFSTSPAGWDLSQANWVIEDQMLQIKYGSEGQHMGFNRAYYQETDFSDYVLTFDVNPVWKNWYGALFNMQDENNYYAVEFWVREASAIIYKVIDGTLTQLGYVVHNTGTEGAWSEVKIKNTEGKTTVYQDNVAVFTDVETTEFLSGKLALFDKDMPIQFDNLVVESLNDTSGIKYNTPPKVSIALQPAGNKVDLGDPVILAADALDAEGSVDYVEFFNGTAYLGKSDAAPYSFTIENASSPVYYFTAIAYDNGGIYRKSAVLKVNTLQLQNDPPTVSLLKPANQSEYPTGSMIVLKADANDRDGYIAKVEFLANEQVIGSKDKPPFSFTWMNPVADDYQLKARAFDQEGAMVTSLPVAVKVKEPTDIEVINMDKKEYEIYPNPLTERTLFIELPETAVNSSITIYSPGGVILLQKPISGGQEIITFENNVKPGLFFVEIKTGGNVYKNKIVFL
jgi:hypothetical protein